jgi:cell division protein FtsQ
VSRQRSARPLPPGVERRRRLRQERRREQLIQVWRLLLFSGSATALGWLLLSLGWTLRSPEQLRVNGSERIDSEAVTKVAGLSFPLPLLSLDPRALERTLLQELPVQSAAVHRRLLPPALDVVLEDRRPIAAASRVSPGGMERGMIDRNGQWMPQTVASRGDRPETSILVMGWTARHRPILAQLLERRDALGSPLQRISIAPDGAISLQTAALGRVDLGADPNLLDQQVVSMAQLSRSLPSHLRQKAGTSIDLSDPAKPELQLRAGKTPASES